MKQYIITLLLLCISLGAKAKDADRTSYTITKTDNGNGSYTLTADVPDDYGVVYWFGMDGAAGMEPGTEDDYMPNDLRRGQTNKTYHHYGKYWKDRQFYLVYGDRMSDTDVVLVGKGKTITITAAMIAKYGKAFRYQAYQSEDDAKNNTRDLTKVYTNFISFGNVIYVDGTSGSDNNDGKSLSTAKKTLTSAYSALQTLIKSSKGTMNSNVIVVKGSPTGNVGSTLIANGYPYTLTSRYADYVGDKGTATCATSYQRNYDDIKFENIVLANTTNQMFLFNFNGRLQIWGAGLIMKNWSNLSNNLSWGTYGCTVPGICPCGQKDTPGTTSTAQESSTYTADGFPTGSEIYFLSGYYGRVLGCGRSDNENSYNHNIVGVYNHPLESKIVFDIDNSFYTDAEKKQVIGTSTAPTVDVGFVAGGMANGSCYQICDFEVKRGYIYRFVAGGVGYGRDNPNHYPTDSYFGKSTVNVYDGTIHELFGGTMGRVGSTYSGYYFYRGFFYGESDINIFGGTVESNIYAAGCGGTSGIGDDTNHTNDLAIPYLGRTASDNFGSINYGSYKEFKASGQAMPSMTSHFFFTDTDGADYTFNLANTKASANVSGGTVKGSVYGGGFGYSNYLETSRYAWATYLAGCFFGDTYVNITGGTINGTVYGGGAGAGSISGTGTGQNSDIKTYHEDNTKQTIPSSTINLYDTSIQTIINNGKFYSHDALGRVYGDTHVNISGSPVITGDVYAGAAGINSKYTYQKTTNASYVHDDNPYKEMAMVIGNTNLSIKGSPSIGGNIYGGGQSASVTGNTNISIEGGTIAGQVFGGGQGIDEGHVETSSKTYIVMANVGGNSNVNITGGTFSGNIFGSGNYYGNQSGIANVDVNGASVSITGNVYGGGNIASYTPTLIDGVRPQTPIVNLKAGTVTGSLYGGGLGTTAIVTANPQVTMSGGTVTQNVFGGGDAAKVDGNTSVTVKGPSTVNGKVYGGGNAAEVTGITHVQIGE